MVHSRSKEGQKNQNKRKNRNKVRKLDIRSPKLSRYGQLQEKWSLSSVYRKISFKNVHIQCNFNTEEPSIRFYHKFFQGSELDRIVQLDSWMLSHNYNSVDDCRGAHQTISLGTWVQRGGPRTVHRTPETIKEPVRNFICSYTDIWTKVGNQIRMDFPQTSEELEQLDPQLRLFDLFSYLIMNRTPVSKEHVDWNDHELCVVIPTSDLSTSGFIHFRHLSLLLSVRRGDVLVFNSRRLLHGLMDATPDRRSIVLTTHNTILDRGRNPNNWRLYSSP